MLRTVEIVNKNDHLLSWRRAVVTLAALVQLGINEILRHIRCGASRKAHEVRHILLRKRFCQVFSDVHALASAGRTNKQRWLLMTNAHIEYECVSCSVHRWDNDLLKLHCGWDLGLWKS